MQEKQLADRFNEGKVRMDLLPEYPIREMAKVFTYGATKYAPFNWLKGLKWMSCLASMKRHIAQFESGEDFDIETGLPHMAHAMTNAAFLIEYSRTYPQGDDRPLNRFRMPKIGLDIDDVLADFVPAFAAKYGLPTPTSWQWSYRKDECFADLMSDKQKLHEFFINLPVRTRPEDIPFEPHCYITSRSIPVEITKQWLEINGFPCAPVYTVNFDHSKVDVARESGIEIYIDDKYENFVELNNAGICTYLFDCCHNQRYNVGHKRIKEIKDLPFFK
jgi:hypothetical protein